MLNCGLNQASRLFQRVYPDTLEIRLLYSTTTIQLLQDIQPVIQKLCDCSVGSPLAVETFVPIVAELREAGAARQEEGRYPVGSF